LPQLQPLKLINQGDFIWSYGHHDPVMPIPSILKEIVESSKFVGVAGEYSIKTELLPMLLNMLRSSVLKLVDTVIQQNADILHKIYADTPQKIKLNNEVGMDWVRRNFENFPNIVAPNMSK
jgi:hypothetical protein